jgi:uncharacterized BrkB/YihY/UPF0761 family membrane protein
VASGLVGLTTVVAADLRERGWLALIPVWIACSTIFWLWTPRLLLHRKIPLRALLPGALLAAVAVGGTIGTAPFWISPAVNQNAKAFGSFGVTLVMLGFVLVVITISMICAVFPPVWAEWRQAERDRRDRS